jgi:hypothetical protein
MDELDVDGIQALAGLRQELTQQIVHRCKPSETGTTDRRAPYWSRDILSVNSLRLVATAHPMPNRKGVIQINF